MTGKQFWLLKTEPSTYSFQRLLREGRTAWDGVRNNLALMHLRAMHPGDEALIYHSGSEKAVVGLARIVSSAYPEPGQDDLRFVAVDIEALEALPTTVQLATIRQDPGLAGLALVKNSRLSAMPVTPGEWRRLLALAKG